MREQKLLQSQQPNEFEELRGLGIEIWGIMELAEDPMFRHIKPEQVLKYISGAAAEGKRTAEQFDRDAVKKMLELKKTEITYSPGNHPLGIHAQTIFEKGCCRIEIYEEAVKTIAALLKEKGILISCEELSFLHIAHEFYHCLQYWESRDMSRSFTAVSYRLLGILPCRGFVRRTEEIGAHLFAKEVCGFTFHPKLLDYLLLEKQSVWQAKRYLEQCISVKKQWERGYYGNNPIWE